MLSKLLKSAAVLSVAEVLASLSVWTGGPTDQRGEPPHFWAFELWRLKYWALLFSLTAFLWLAVWGIFRVRRPKILFPSSLAMAAVSVEILTSVWFWRQLSWSEASFLGWPYLPWYVWNHLLPWTVIVALALGVGYLWSRRQGTSGSAVAKP